MAILQSCCCWQSVRRGSYASAFYTLVYFVLAVIGTSGIIYEEWNFLMNKHNSPSSQSFLESDNISPTTLIFGIILFFCAIFGIIASFLLIYGLYTDERIYLIPWILILVITINLDLAFALFIFIKNTLKFNPINAIMFTFDFFLLTLHIYSLLCVISQYQEYRDGRGTAAFDRIQVPSVEYTAAVTTTATSYISGASRPSIYRKGGGSSSIATALGSPSRSPSGAHALLTPEPSAPSSRPSSRKHVQFPTNCTNGDTKIILEQKDTISIKNEVPSWKVNTISY